MSRPVIFDLLLASEVRKLLGFDLVGLKDMYKDYLIEPDTLEQHFVVEESEEFELMNKLVSEFDAHARNAALMELENEQASKFI